MKREKLDRICRDRKLETVEAFGENAYYGMARILKWYAGYPEGRAVKAVIPHGIVMDPGFVSPAEKKIPLPAVLCYPAYRLETYRRQTGKWVIPSASPYLYMLKMLREVDRSGEGSPEKGTGDPGEREGTLFFPAHSTHHITAEMNYARLAERLAELDGELQPVDVCLYWRDYNLGRAEPFRERGLKVVSAGHMFDPDFLFRFHELCRQYQYAGSNEIGSNLFYAVKSGCSFFFLDHEVNRSASPDRLPENLLDFDHARAEMIYGMFGEPVPETTPDQSKLVDRFLGAKYMLSSTELRDLFHRLERMDKLGRWSGKGLPSFPWLARKMGRLYPGYAVRALRERLEG